MFLNEASDKLNNNQMRKLLFKDRIRLRKDLLLLLDRVKEENEWIKYAFPMTSKYLNRNLFVDLYYYNAIFFENNTWVAKKGFNLHRKNLTWSYAS